MARSRATAEQRAERRQQKVEAQWGGQALDTSWMQHRPCYLCGFNICVNNYQDRKVRTRSLRVFPNNPRILLCPLCRSRGGVDQVKRKLLISLLIKEGRCLAFDERGRPADNNPKTCKCAYHVAVRVFG